jgi:hypothetical protein
MATRSGPPPQQQPQLTLTLTPDKPQYAAGTLPSFRAVIKNAGTTPVKLCTYMLRYRLLAAINVKEAAGQDYALFPFTPAKFAPVKPADIKTLAPGQEISEQLTVTQEWGFVKNGSLPPIVSRNFIMKGFPAGTYTFSTGIFGGMAVYQGEPDAYDSKWVKKKLPEELASAEKLDPTGVFRGELEGKTKIKFS